MSKQNFKLQKKKKKKKNQIKRALNFELKNIIICFQKNYMGTIEINHNIKLKKFSISISINHLKIT